MKCFIFIFLSLFFLKSFSHPVIYKGGFSYTQKSTALMNMQDLSYSFNERFAFAMSSDYYAYLIKDYRDYSIGINFLAYRQLRKKSQANVYFKAHLGTYRLEGKDSVSGNKNPLLAKMSVIIDWESRRYYTEARIKYYRSLEDRNLQFFNSFFRLGFAPYKGKTNQLQSWFILQAQVHSKSKSYVKNIEEAFDSLFDDDHHDHYKKLEFKLTPMLRFFYSNVLLEVGSSLKGEYFTTLMFHY